MVGTRKLTYTQVGFFGFGKESSVLSLTNRMYKNDEVYRYSAEELRVTNMHCLRREEGTASTHTGENTRLFLYRSFYRFVLFCFVFLSFLPPLKSHPTSPVIVNQYPETK